MFRQANAAATGQPLTSWYSFEDPGPLPPMPTPAPEDTTPSDPWGSSTQSPTAPISAQAATASKQPQTQPSIDPWAAPVEPSAEGKAVESEVLAASIAGLDGDAWGGSTFGQDRLVQMGIAEPTGKAPNSLPKGKPMAATGPVGKAAEAVAKGVPAGGAAPGKGVSPMAGQGELSWVLVNESLTTPAF